MTSASWIGWRTYKGKSEKETRERARGREINVKEAYEIRFGKKMCSERR